MLKNYLKIALRQLLKQKMYAAIKIGGFALSIAACLLIALYIRHEVSFDRYYPGADHIYRVVGEMTDYGKVQKGVSWPAVFAKTMKNEFPEVEMTARLMPNQLFTGAGNNQVRRADKAENTYEQGFSYADPELLQLLNIPLIYGDPAHALDGPNTIIISKRKADKYFPNENPVGKVLILNDDLNKPYRIGGVMQDFPDNSHLQYDFLLSLKGIEFWRGEQTTWMASNYEVYTRLRSGTDVERFNAKVLGVLLNKYYIPALKQVGSKEVERIGKTMQLRIFVQPVKDIHLRSYDIEDSAHAHGDIRFVWLFGAIAAFILIIACINFINLSTARSANRAREVGLKKAIGSYRSDLVKQFLSESLLYSFLSFAIGIVMAWLLLPYFNTLSGKSLFIPWSAWWLAPLFIISAFVIGIVAGLYPAFYLSSFQPIAVLKGQLSMGTKNSNLRSTLVVFQFTTSIILIIGTFVIYRQMQFILNRELGFEKDQVLMIEGANTLGKQVGAFKQELLQLPQVQHVSVSDFLPVEGTKRNGNPFWKEGKQTEESEVSGQFWNIDDDYVETMGMHIVAGRNFSKDIAADSQRAIINQSMATELFPGEKDVIGKRFTNSSNAYEIVGVVQDFNFESMRNSIIPVCMVLGNSPTIISIKLKTADMQKTIAAVTGVWKSIAPQQPLRYTFLDQRFAAMYDDVRRTGWIFTSFAILAIIVACLGLFALSAYMAEQRSKEISIRKVLGASVAQVTALVSRDFVKLVVIAVLLATPLAWWGMNKWLQDFAYRINISWWIFAAAGMLAVFVALVTIGFQSIKAAVANPVDSLRGE